MVVASVEDTSLAEGQDLQIFPPGVTRFPARPDAVVACRLNELLHSASADGSTAPSDGDFPECESGADAMAKQLSAMSRGPMR